MKIGFVGGGNMAYALISGLVRAHDVRLHVVGRNPDTLAKLAAEFGATTATQADAALLACDAIVLAVKPQQMRNVAGELAKLGALPLVLSVAAGIRATDLSRWLDGHAAVVRSMPNTPALIGAGMTGLAALPGVSDAQRALAETIMGAVGQALWLDDEAQLDAVTAISGSGPAYVFYFIEALQQAAKELGLTAEQGRRLALGTFTGAAQLAAQSDEPVSVLRERVTSKGGTTFAALESMREAGVAQAIAAAAHAAAARSRELGDEFGRQ
jgi:pyrroline-5-carboxylate reductase